MTLPDPIIETDFVSYVDGQLSPERQIAVEAHLAAHPSLAARIMADLRGRHELKLALAEPALPGSLRTAEAARRLERTLGRRRFTASLRRVAAIGLFIAVGWLAHAELGLLGVREVNASAQPPAFVNDAVIAHRTAAVRADMPSQVGSSRYAPAEILAATAIAMPALPADWQVTDVQVFPSPFGPSVEMEVETELGALSVFAVRPGRFDVLDVSTTTDADVTAAYWQVGEVGYALVADTAPREALDRAAAALSRTLY
jgi:anti-sigma factor RsiW